MQENLKKKILETKSTKRVEQVSKLMEWLQTITKTRGADKYNKNKKTKTQCQNTANNHDKSVPELNKKRCLKTEPQKSTRGSKNYSRIGPQNDFTSGVAPLETPLVAQTACVIKK